MTDSAKVILHIEEERSNKEEGRRNTGLAALPSGPASLSASPSGTSSPPLLTASKVERQPLSCDSIRKEIVRSRPLITQDQISYARLSLLVCDANDFDGDTYDRLAANMDCSFNNSTQFQKFKWRVTNKRSEFYANIPGDWQQEPVYAEAWEYYNSLATTRWIGKACYRNASRSQRVRLQMVPLTAAVFWFQGELINYRFWFEDAQVTGVFNLPPAGRHYAATSNPINNFQPDGFRMLEI